jgi:hypothetical protein
MQSHTPQWPVNCTLTNPWAWLTTVKLQYCCVWDCYVEASFTLARTAPITAAYYTIHVLYFTPFTTWLLHVVLCLSSLSYPVHIELHNTRKFVAILKTALIDTCMNTMKKKWPNHAECTFRKTQQPYACHNHTLFKNEWEIPSVHDHILSVRCSSTMQLKCIYYQHKPAIIWVDGMHAHASSKPGALTAPMSYPPVT